MMLFISYLDFDSLEVGLIDGMELKQCISQKTAPEGALKAINNALNKWGVDIKQGIEAIVVVEGPGSPTACREAVAISDTMGMVLNIPVIGLINPDKISAQELIAKNENIIKESLKAGDAVQAGVFYKRPPAQSLNLEHES